MDDLQFRRSIFADPNAKDEDIIAALADDPKKQKLAHELEQLDESIKSALEIPVPDDLCDKLILRQSMASHRQQTRRKRIHLALAASFALTVGFTFSYFQFSHAYDSVGDYAFAHVNHEAKYFSNDSVADISLTKLNSKMASFNGQFSEQLGELMMADFCRFDGMQSLHLVLRGEKSPVNIFVIPKNEHLTFEKSFDSKLLQGQSQQYKHGNIIIVGDRSEKLDKWFNKVNENLTWSI